MKNEKEREFYKKLGELVAVYEKDYKKMRSDRYIGIGVKNPITYFSKYYFSKSTFTNIKNGKSKISLFKLFTIIRYFERRPSEFMTQLVGNLKDGKSQS